MQLADILAWLERHAVRITFQQLPPSRKRLKNRCIVEYIENGQPKICAGTTLCQAVSKAVARSRISPAA
jgi:hypothetical protein